MNLSIPFTMTPLCTFLFLMAAPMPIAAQATGGESETLFKWNGAAYADSFGWATSNAGDVNADGIPDLIVGVPGADPNGILLGGSAFVYSGADGALLYQWDGSDAFCQFGYSVSGAGDVNADGFDDLIIGTPLALPGGQTWAGSAFVYSGASGSLLYQWDGQSKMDQFGYCVAAAGDINNDGFADVIIGAPTAFPTASGYGSADIYSGADGSLLFQWTGQQGSSFGETVACAGDLNNDGILDVIVGAPDHSPNGRFEAGSVFAYSGANGSQLYQWNGGKREIELGSSISPAGDVNNDGFDDVILGAPYADPGQRDGAGSAFVYSGADGSSLYRWNGQVEFDAFGVSVADAGDVNGDGYADLLIGSVQAVYDPGEAHLYSGMDGMLLHSWQGTSRRAGFGTSVDGAGDIDGDGHPDLIVSAPTADPGGVLDAGTVSIFSFHSYLLANTATVSATTGGVLDLDLNFPDAAGLTEYKILISNTGIGPIHFGVDIPLSMDSWVNDSAHGNYPIAIHSNMQGTLDAIGTASASLTMPAGIPLALVGHSFFIAAVAHPSGQLPEYCSVAVSITIIP